MEWPSARPHGGRGLCGGARGDYIVCRRPAQGQRRPPAGLLLVEATGAIYGLWPMVRRKAVLGRYAVLRCLWHEVRDDERSNR
eukprot:5383800-Prymnesium_polylepis.1